jgi:mpaB/rubber oxygenase-like protein
VSALSAQIEALDPERDAQEIVRLVFLQAFPWDGTRALEFALFRTYAVPSIGALLEATGEFTERTQKRYDDTDLLIHTFVAEGYESELGRRAIRRMNQIHSRFQISNADYLYVLSTFVLEPIRWIARYGSRPLSQVEQQACYVFWREVGRRMALDEIPPDLASLEDYNLRYEREHFAFSEPSRRVALATRELLLSWYLPRWLRPLGEPWVHALLDEPLLEAFGFPKPSRLRRALAEGALRWRGRLSGWLPERRRPQVIPDRGARTYPEGYTVEGLGPEPPRGLAAAFLKDAPSPDEG